MIKLPNTLSFRLTLWYASVFVLFIATAFIALFFSLNTVFDNRFDEDLVEDIEEFEQLYNSGGIIKVEEEIRRETALSAANKAFLRLLGKQGQTIFSSDMSAWQDITTNQEVINQLGYNPDPVIQTIAVANHEYPIKVIYGFIAPDLILHLGETTAENAEIMELLFIAFLGMFIVATPFASFVGWLMARRAASGIEEVSRTAATIEHGHMDKRVSIKTKDKEIQYLINAFNAMLDRIHILVTELREMTDNIAHDLRSPLARVRAIAELTLSNFGTPEDCKKAASDTIEECDLLLQMINATLDVAEAESGISDAISQEIDISAITRDACELFEPVAEEKQIELSCSVGSGCQTFGNMQYLQRMLANLIDNALKYTPAKGQVNITLTCTAERIIISVADTGEGIPLEDQERIFDRFYRCEKSRTHQGCGMGLNFSRAVARAHGGEIAVESTPGAGAVFVIFLPVKQKSS